MCDWCARSNAPQCASIISTHNVLCCGAQSILDQKADALGESNLLLNTIFYWDYGFREAPAFSNAFSFVSPTSQYQEVLTQRR